MFPLTEPTTPPDARAASVEAVSSELTGAAAAPAVPVSSESRQIRWQQKQLKKNNCRQCGRPKVNKHHCADCAEKIRIRARNRYRLKVGIPIDAPLTGNGRPVGGFKVQVPSFEVGRVAPRAPQEPVTLNSEPLNSVQP